MRRSPAQALCPNGSKAPTTNSRRLWTGLTRRLPARARRDVRVPQPRRAGSLQWAARARLGPLPARADARDGGERAVRLTRRAFTRTVVRGGAATLAPRRAAAQPADWPQTVAAAKKEG